MHVCIYSIVYMSNIQYNVLYTIHISVHMDILMKLYKNPEIKLRMYILGFLGGSVLKNLPLKQETVSIPGSQRSLEKEMATHSSVLA